ncbi:hypothetical protein Tco_0049472, partial [Tanacetum coccineum]
QKKEEDKRIAEEQAAKDQYWKIPICYDDDEDYAIATTPVSSTKEPVDSLIMEDEHLNTIPSVENLVLIPSEFEGIPDDTDDDSYENIEHVEASPLNLEIDSLEEVNKDQEEKEFDLEDIFQIQDVILREKLLNISRLVTNIESLKDKPTPDRVLKSTFSFPIPIADMIIRKRREVAVPLLMLITLFPSMIHFFFEVEPDQGRLISIVISDNSKDPLLEFPEFESFHFDLYDNPSFPRPPPEPPDVEISLIVETDVPVINNVDELNEDECFDPGGGEINIEVDNSFTFVTQTFLSYLTYPE